MVKVEFPISEYLFAESMGLYARGRRDLGIAVVYAEAVRQSVLPKSELREFIDENIDEWNMDSIIADLVWAYMPPTFRVQKNDNNIYCIISDGAP
jgi:hypothetical protein